MFGWFCFLYGYAFLRCYSFQVYILILETKELIRILLVCIRTKERAYNQDFTVFSLYEPHQIVISPFKIIIEKTKLTKKKKNITKNIVHTEKEHKK